MQEIIQDSLYEITINYTEQMDIDDANEQQEEIEDLLLKELWLVVLTIEYSGM